MVVYWNLSARLQGIEETVAFVLKTLMKVVVHSQPWGFFCLVSHLCK